MHTYGYEWETIKDPDEDGCFRFRKFRLSDICQSASNFGWPDGITWRNTYTGEILTYLHGELFLGGEPVDLSTNKMTIQLSSSRIVTSQTAVS